MDKRLGFVGIIVHDRQANAPAVNRVLHDFGDSIVSRTGMPYAERECSVITLIVDMDTDELGKLAGRLGNVEGVSVRSMLSKA